MRRPQMIDVAMIVAAAGSYFHHIHGPRLIELFGWWTLWAVLWVLWGRSVGSLIGAIVSLVVLLLITSGPRTDLGFRLNRDCFEAKAQTALTAHAPEQYRNIDYQGDDRCGLMRFAVQTQQVEVLMAGTNVAQEEKPLVVVFRGAGQINWGLIDGNGIIFSPQGEPRCNNGVVGTVDDCRPERIGESGWYYYSYSGGFN